MDPEVDSDGASSGLKFLLLEITVVGVIIIAALFFLNYFSILSLSTLSPKFFSSLPQKTQPPPQQQYLFPSPPADSTNTILIPVALNNPNVNSTAILYNMDGTIDTIETKNNVTTITLKQDDPIIPPISLLGDTIVKQQIKSDTEVKLEEAQIDDLKAEQKVAFTAIYDPKTGSWKGYNVIILATSL